MATCYDSHLNRKGWPTRVYDRETMNPVMVRYPIRVQEKEKALNEASKSNIELGSWFESPLHPKETVLSNYDYVDGMCPQAEKASREVVNLPLHPRVNEKIVRKTIDFITRFTPVT